MMFFRLQCFALLLIFGNTTKANILKTIQESQFAALNSFYNATGYSPYGNASASQPGTIVDDGDLLDVYCDHPGVFCDNEGFVLSIDLRESGLNGTIPSEIGDFVRLRALRLNDNDLFGELPTSLLEMASLRYLNLGHNMIEGAFPDVTGLTSLRRLILDRNAFSGTLPNSICELTNLEALDLSACTKLHGTLPSCLGRLNALNVLRITDMGLTGSIPTELCDGREMNGFVPNLFGCSAIGCDAGYFHRGAGRQTELSNPCIPCNVPSNALSSSTCHWISEKGSTVDDAEELEGTGGSQKPSEMYTSTLIPSYAPTIPPTTESDTTTFPRDMQPSVMPSLRTMHSTPPSSKPTNLSISTEETYSIASTPAPSQQRSSQAPTINIFLDASGAKSATSAGGLVGGSATAGACVLIFLLFILSRQGPPKYFVRAENDEASDRTIVQNIRPPARRRVVQPLAIPSFRSPESLSTIDEEDSAAVSRSDSLESTAKLPSLLEPQSPPNLREARGAKKVRFALPPSPTIDQTQAMDPFDIELASEPTATFQNVDKWATWIMNPAFEPPAFCSPAMKSTADDERSWHSLDAASTNSATPILARTAADSSSTTQSSMRVLGIQNRKDSHSGTATLTETTSRPKSANGGAVTKLNVKEVKNTNGERTNSSSSKSKRQTLRRKGMAEI